jgi:hypothetical protein
MTPPSERSESSIREPSRLIVFVITNVFGIGRRKRPAPADRAAGLQRVSALHEPESGWVEWDGFRPAEQLPLAVRQRGEGLRPAPRQTLSSRSKVSLISILDNIIYK